MGRKKIIILICITIILIATNVVIISNTVYNSTNQSILPLKSLLKPTEKEFRSYIDSVYQISNYEINNDAMMKNKWEVLLDNKVVGYSIIIHEKIPCPTCSDLNYIVFFDRDYIIRDFIFLGKMVENYEDIDSESFMNYVSNFKSKSIYSDISEFSTSTSAPIKHKKYFYGSLLKLINQMKVFYEKS